MRALQNPHGSALAGEVSVSVGSYEEFGKIADNEDNVLNVGLYREELEQPIANGTRNKECITLGKKAFAFRTEQEDRLYAEIVDIVITVDNPKTVVNSREFGTQHLGDFGKIDKPINKTGAGDELLEVGGDSSTRGQNQL